MTGRIITTLLALAGALCAGAQAPRGESRILTDSLMSEGLGAWVPYTIYLPSGYDDGEGRSYPILYLLHGYLEDNTTWFRTRRLKDVMDLLAASGEACGMIVVSPKAGGKGEGVVNGYFNVDGWAYEDFFFGEFMPHVEGRYRVAGDRAHRAIAGLSMGGGGTVRYAEKRPDLFRAAYAMSALLDDPMDGVEVPGHADGGLEALRRSAAENSCLGFLREAGGETLERLREVAWFIDCGDDDHLLGGNLELFRMLRGAGIPCELRVRDGGHVQEYWHTALYQCLPFVTRAFGK